MKVEWIGDGQLDGAIGNAVFRGGQRVLRVVGECDLLAADVEARRAAQLTLLAGLWIDGDDRRGDLGINLDEEDAGRARTDASRDCLLYTSPSPRDS